MRINELFLFLQGFDTVSTSEAIVDTVTISTVVYEKLMVGKLKVKVTMTYTIKEDKPKTIKGDPLVEIVMGRMSETLNIATQATLSELIKSLAGTRQTDKRNRHYSVESWAMSNARKDSHLYTEKTTADATSMAAYVGRKITTRKMIVVEAGYEPVATNVLRVTFLDDPKKVKE